MSSECPKWMAGHIVHNPAKVHAIRPHQKSSGKGTFHSSIQKGKITHEPVR
jgi:hypothetical protein